MRGKKKVVCPKCGGECQGKDNPRRCAACRSLTNLVVVSAKMRLADLPKEVIEQALELVHNIGQYLLKQQKMRLDRFRVVPGGKGECGGCGKEKNLYLAREGARYCLACAEDESFGEKAKKEIFPSARKEFPQVTRLTIFHPIWNRAASMTQRWFKENRKTFIDRAAVRAYIEGRKAKALALPRSDSEAPEIVYLRETWARSRYPVCLIRRIQNYALGQGKNRNKRKGKISTHYRRARRERLRQLNAVMTAVPKEVTARYRSKRSRKPPKRLLTIPKFVYHLVAPICADDCPNLVNYQWGWECKLHDWREHPAPSDFPAFPKTIFPLWSESYEVLRDYVEIVFWQKGKKETGAILGKRWLAEAYDYETFVNSAHPTLWQRKEKGKKETEEYLQYPKTEVIPVRSGSWTHVIACGPYSTVCWSRNGSQRAVKYFRHAELVSIKQYYQSQRARARRDKWEYFFDIKRDNERRWIRDRFHTETARVVKAIEALPGRVIMVKMRKRRFRRETFERKTFNRLLSRWPEQLFRQLVRYKLERAGFAVMERECDLGRVPLCPRCGEKLGQSWQDLMVVQALEKMVCACGEDFNLLLALAETVYWRPNLVSPPARKKKEEKVEADETEVTIEAE